MKIKMCTKIILSIIIAFAFVSCNNSSNNDEPTPQPEFFTITFEDFYLGNNSVWDGSDMSGGFSLNDVWFSNNYVNEYGGYSNGGFSVSCQTDMGTAGFGNQYSVYSNGGANGSKQFAVVFYSSYAPENSRFTLNKKASKIKSLKVNNSTYAYLAMKNGDSYTNALGENDWFKVIFEGYLDSKSVGKVEFYLADFREGKTYICKEWTNVNLLGLGEVDEVRISVDGSDVSEYGLNTPSYVCIDDIEIEK
jgi:hypothetical protein